MINNNTIRRILRESVAKVLRESEAALNVSSSSKVGDSIASTDAKPDNNGTKSYSTPVSNMNNSTDNGSDMVITGKSGAECQSKLQKSKSQNSQFFSNPANKVHFKVNPTGNINI